MVIVFHKQPQVQEHLRIQVYPDRNAIIASGYAKTKEVDIAQALGAGKYIKKPYILEKIGLAVKEELEK